jgi:hypothetical protein
LFLTLSFKTQLLIASETGIRNKSRALAHEIEILAYISSWTLLVLLHWPLDGSLSANRKSYITIGSGYGHLWTTESPSNQALIVHPILDHRF